MKKDTGLIKFMYNILDFPFNTVKQIKNNSIRRLTLLLLVILTLPIVGILAFPTMVSVINKMLKEY